MTSTLAAPPAGAPPAAPKPRLRRVRYEPEPGRSGTDPPLPTRPAPEPTRSPTTTAERAEAHHAITRLLRLALEVLDGRRLPAHLAAYFEPAVMRYWRVVTQQRRVRSPARFRRMRVCLPRSGVAEVAVTCDIDGRARALAARFERGPGVGWRCTALRLG